MVHHLTSVLCKKVVLLCNDAHHLTSVLCKKVVLLCNDVVCVRWPLSQVNTYSTNFNSMADGADLEQGTNITTGSCLGLQLPLGSCSTGGPFNPT